MGDCSYLYDSNTNIKPFRKFEGMWALKHEQSVSLQMRYSIEELETELADEGNPHLLQLVDNNSLGWILYADGKAVIRGHYSAARECFENGPRVFYDSCRSAVTGAELERLSAHDYYMLQRARDVSEVLDKQIEEERQKRADAAGRKIAELLRSFS